MRRAPLRLATEEEEEEEALAYLRASSRGVRKEREEMYRSITTLGVDSWAGRGACGRALSRRNLFLSFRQMRGGAARRGCRGVGAGGVENERMRDGAACEERAMARVCGVGR